MVQGLAAIEELTTSQGMSPCIHFISYLKRKLLKLYYQKNVNENLCFKCREDVTCVLGFPLVIKSHG